MGSFTNFPASLAAILQQNFLERELEEGLDSILAYRREALQETISARIGETLTRTRKGRKAPTSTALVASSMTGLDNGLTPSNYTVEQYSFTMSTYGDTADVNIHQELATIADQLISNSRNNGVQAGQSLERIARLKLFGAYLGGNTYVRTDLAASTTVTCRVDDIRGFQFVLVNGVPTAVSGANPLTVAETAAYAGGVTQTLSVTTVAADATNQSLAPDGVSGLLTFASATIPVDLDALVALNAPKIFRPFAKINTTQLTGGDVFTMGIVEDAVAYMRDNGVPPMEDGTYHCILDNTSLRQLFADQDFKVLYAGRDQSSEYRDGEVLKLLGVTFIPTTEAYVQNTNVTVGVNVRVRRPIIMGAESLIQGNFEGMEIWLQRDGVDAISNVMLVDGVAQIVRPPLDRFSEQVSLTWKWTGDFAVPTDLTATSSIIPTASNALFKRAAVIEHAG